MIEPELATPAEIDAAAQAITATEDQIRLNGAAELLSVLFPHGLTYRTKDLAAIDEPSQEWETIASELFAAPQLGRAQLEVLLESTRKEPTRAKVKAFAYTVNTLLVDGAAKHQRAAGRNRRFMFELTRFAILVVLVVLLRLVALVLAQRALLSSARRLQDDVFSRVHDTALVDAGALGRPSMVSRCSSYVDTVQKVLIKAQTEGIADLAALVLSVAFLIYLDLPMALLMLGVLAVFEIVRRLVSGQWSRIAHERLDLNTALSEVIDLSIANSNGIRAARSQSPTRQNFIRRADAVVRHTRRLEIFGEVFRISAFGFGQFSVLAVIAVVGFARRDMTLAHATAVVLYVREVAASLEDVPKLVVELQEAAPYMRRLRRVLAAPLRRAEPATPQPFPALAEHLMFEHVAKVYPDDSPGCEGVSFVAARGPWTVLVGGPGSGKAGALDLAAGLELPDIGSVRVGAVDSDTVDLASIQHFDLARQVVVLPEDPPMFEGSVLDNLTLNCNGADDEDLYRIIEEVGLRGWIDSMPGGLGTVVGQRRQHLELEVRVRLTIARMILSPARIVVIHDPSRRLDREVGDDLWTLMHRAFAGRVVVAETDRLDRLADDEQVLCLRQGTIVETGRRQELLARNGTFTALWGRLVDGADQFDDLAAIPSLAALSADSLRDLSGRLVTEQFPAGSIVYSAGSPTDRVYIVVEGVVDLVEDDRLAGSVRSGGHFGDVDPAEALLRTGSARARTDVVLRSLHRLSISRGVAGVLDRPDDERVLYTWITRHGIATRPELDVLAGRIDVDKALSGLLGVGMLTAGTDAAGDATYAVAGARRQRARSTALLDSLFSD
jgi:ABC-type branched-subunit amino acid transport system ATPase component